MRNVLLTLLLAVVFCSCGKMKTYTCTCVYKAIPGVPDKEPVITETFTAKGRTFEKASSNCQVDNRLKYSGQYYQQGVCTIK